MWPTPPPTAKPTPQPSKLSNTPNDLDSNISITSPPTSISDSSTLPSSSPNGGDSPESELTHVSSAPPPNSDVSSSTSTIQPLRISFRDGDLANDTPEVTGGLGIDPGGRSRGSDKDVAVSKRMKTVPKEQSEEWVRTRAKVSQATASILGKKIKAELDVLVIGVDAVRFAPIAELKTAARVLLNIWDSLQSVDLNRLACLRLTERCADILISVRQEVADAGGHVWEELKAPIVNLVESFTVVQRFLQKQANRPFLARYLNRNEILKQISVCDSELSDCLGMFSLSVQIRILRQIQHAEAQRQADIRALGDALSGSSGIPSPLSHHSPSQLEPLSEHTTPRTQSPTNENDIPTSSSPIPGSSSPEITPSTTTANVEPTPSTILPTIQALHTAQNAADVAHDIHDLRSLMRAALQAKSDLEMIEVLQVGREEVPEAIQALQRALGKGDFEKGDNALDSTRNSGDGEETENRDELDREFTESGIDALKRLTGILPSWTITRYEIEREEKIGIGYYFEVYRGTWLSQTVAIKIFFPQIPKSLFVHEVTIWRGLRHPNVLELLGANSATERPPWFLVTRFCHGGSLVKWLRGIGEVEWLEAVGGGRNGEGKNGKKPDRVDLLRMIHEIAKGMDYLHGVGVLHGDLKAANVLVDDHMREDIPRCVISDFGQSEMRSEASRLGGIPPHRGTLRWQAPELMSGKSQLTSQSDVYAFAISCVEILNKGSLPWPILDDESVRFLVLKENSRPSFPLTGVRCSPVLLDLLKACWHRDPLQRPTFSWILAYIGRLRNTSGPDMSQIIADSERLQNTSESDVEQTTYQTAGGITASSPQGRSSHIIPGHRRPHSTKAPELAPKPLYCQDVANQLLDCDADADSPDLSIGTAPSDWLDWNTAWIVSCVRCFPLLPDAVKEICISGVKNVSIYQRLLVYTFTHLAACVEDKSTLDSLRNAVDSWQTMDDITTLLNHRQISTCIRKCLLASGRSECIMIDTVNSLLLPDVMCMAARAANIIQHQNSRRFLLALRGDDAQVTIDLIHALLDYCQTDVKLKYGLLWALVKLSRESKLYPKCLLLRGVDLTSKDPQETGGFGDVYKETIRGHEVAMKVIRTFVKSDVDKMARAFSREAVTWAHLSHPNVLPFYGIFHLNDNRTRIGFMSPWMENGTIVDFLRKHPGTDRPPLILDVALGLEYLHTMSPHIVHADLKGVNVLITPSFTACLADFGLTVIGKSQTMSWSMATTSLTGTARWLAPELLGFESTSGAVDCTNTRESDIYAFGCVCYEIFTGNLPFHQILNDQRAMLQVLTGKRPPQPSSDICRSNGLDDDMWGLVEACWHQESSERPNASEIVYRIRSHPGLDTTVRHQQEWDKAFMRDIRSDLERHPFHFLPENIDH